ncbi:MAG: retropepsin-like aspartic protease [Spirosomataceae bacterium]
MKTITVIIIIFLVAYHYCFGQKEGLLNLFQEKQFVKMELANHDRKADDFYFFKAVFANVCNNPNLSNRYLDTLQAKEIPATLMLKYWKLRADNYVKLFDYKKAYETNHYINEHFKSEFTSDHYKGSVNTELIWKSLQYEKVQKIGLNGQVSVPFTKDFGDLYNVKVSINKIDTSFVFDTGAGISVISESLAKQLGLKVFENDSIKVSGFTGIGNKTKLAIADSISIGNLKIYNPYFLIFEDQALTFAEGKYKINGIIGFPILKEIGTITITKNKIQFSNAFKQKTIKNKNLFTEYLHPILYLNFNGDMLPFCFDTGGNETLFSKTFFDRYKTILEAVSHETSTQKIASAGGEISYSSMTMKKIHLKLNTVSVVLKNLEINKEGYHRFGKEYYGNLGKDALSQFSKVIISFKGSYLELKR